MVMTKETTEQLVVDGIPQDWLVRGEACYEWAVWSQVEKEMKIEGQIRVALSDGLCLPVKRCAQSGLDAAMLWLVQFKMPFLEGRAMTGTEVGRWTITMITREQFLRD